MDGVSANRRIRDAIAQLEREVATGRAPKDDYAIAIRRDGTWTYHGSPIERPGIVKLFASVLHRTTDGRYWLVTPAERSIVHVEDVPFMGVELAVEGGGPGRQISVRTNLDHWVPIDEAHPLRMGAQPDGSTAPYVEARDGLELRLARPLHYELADLVEPDPQGRLGVWSAGVFFALHTSESGASR